MTEATTTLTRADPEAMLRVLALGLRTIAADLRAIEDGAAGDADAASGAQ